VTCPHCDSPDDCLATYRRLTSSLIHSWETIPCTSCRYLRINGERVPRPADAIQPRVTDSEKRGTIRTCTECGKRIGNSNRSGMCADCRKAIYGSIYRERCPICGRTKSRTSPVCRECYRRSIPRSTRTVCPVCGGHKHKQAAMCGTCRRAS